MKLKTWKPDSCDPYKNFKFVQCLQHEERRIAWMIDIIEELLDGIWDEQLDYWVKQAKTNPYPLFINLFPYTSTMYNLTPEQFKNEFINVCKMYLQYFDIFGIEKYQMRLSLHDEEGLGVKYVICK